MYFFHIINHKVFCICRFKLREFVNRVLRRMFGAKRDGVTWEWRKLHNEELGSLTPELNPSAKRCLPRFFY
jgi:hypothetical protein